MPKVQFVEVLDVSSKDDRNPPESLLRRGMGGKWLCKRGESNNMISATFRLPEPTAFSRVDIGNCGSASITVLVSRTGSNEFKELVSPTNLRTENDCRSSINSNGVSMNPFTNLRHDTRHEKWDLVRLVCCQPYRRNKEEQFGLSFLSFFDAPTQSPTVSSMDRFKESALRTGSPARKELNFSSNMTRAQKMIAATNLPLSNSVSTDSGADDIFKATVISFLDANSAIINSKSQSDAKSELMQKLQGIMERKLNLMESRLFSQIFRNYISSQKGVLPSGILKPRTSNNQVFTSLGSKKMEDTKLSLLKPQMNDSFTPFNTQTVYFAEVVHNHTMKDGPVSFMGRSGKENTPYLLEKNGLDEEKSIFDGASVTDKKMCLDQPQRDKISPRDAWKTRNEIDRCDSRDCSPDTWLKRKSDALERSQPNNKKRPRENVCSEENESESVSINRVTPAGGWLLNGTSLQKKKLSPPEAKKQDSMKFPFRVSPPPPTDRPASPLSLVDDIDQPSTSSRETVAERNIRLDLERRLAERSPPEQVVQRTSAGKVKGPFCTKGMNTNDSPLRRLSLCDETEEFGSPQARRKLSFVPPNGQDADSGELVECPVCKGFFEGCDINKHLDECAPSPIKKQDDGENDDEMACPICGFWQPKDTVAAHADECAQKRYGA